MKLKDEEAAAIFEVIVQQGIHPNRRHIEPAYLRGMDKLKKAARRYYTRAGKI